MFMFPENSVIIFVTESKRQKNPRKDRHFVSHKDVQSILFWLSHEDKHDETSNLVSSYLSTKISAKDVRNFVSETGTLGVGTPKQNKKTLIG